MGDIFEGKGSTAFEALILILN